MCAETINISNTFSLMHGVCCGAYLGRAGKTLPLVRPINSISDDAGAQGAAVYVPEKEALIWKIKSFPGGREFLLRCKFGLPSVAAEEEAHGRMPPMRVSFEIPYFTVSGIQARRGSLNSREHGRASQLHAPPV